MFLPRALSATTDAQNAMVRLTKVFHAPLVEDEPFDINPDQKFAVEVRNVTFEWEEGASAREARKENESKAGKGKAQGRQGPPASQATPGKPENEKDLKDATPFQVVGIDVMIPRGALVAVVGSVGSGKVSVLRSARHLSCVTELLRMPVIPAARPHRLDAENQGDRLHVRTRRVLSSNRVDSECDSCEFAFQS